MDDLSAFLARLCGICAITAVIIAMMPPLSFGMLPVFVFAMHSAHTYMCSSREMKRMESISRSPVYSHFAETVRGVTTIRAFGRVDDFVAECHQRQDRNTRIYNSLW
eukprot:26928-Eustigmatos_ZCMA.PRE.1